MRKPTYRKQKGKPHDRAFVELDGERRYVGRYDSPESWAEYNKLLAEMKVTRGKRPVPKAEMTIVELCERFDLQAENDYGADSNEYQHYRTVTTALSRLYGRDTVSSFGPVKFEVVREDLASTPDQRKGMHERKRSRGYINKLANRLKRVFKWGVSKELVTSSVYEAVRTVAGLRRGRCGLPDARKVRAVADGHVEATLPYLTPTLRAMVNIQRYTGMRPGETCAMRTCDIDTTGTIWVYTPVDHKTAHLERERKINIGPKGQAILKPLLRPQLEAFIFSPSESERERREAMHKARKTPPGQGNGPGTNRKRCPKWCPGDKYTTDAYTHAILHACRKAFGDDKSKHWTAHRLRHTFATEVRREFGLESSAVALGHASATVTEAHYAERDEQRAREVALKIG